MARKNDLRVQRTGTVINNVSKRQEKALDKAVLRLMDAVEQEFPKIRIFHESRVY